jgi:hypothetical protein
MCKFAWCAGLFCGEGSAGVDKNGQLQLSIGMLDHVAIEKFASVMRITIPKNRRFKVKGRVNVSYNAHIKGGIFARVHLGGPYAAYVARAMLPFLKGTAKGTQITNALKRWKGGK